MQAPGKRRRRRRGRAPNAQVESSAVGARIEAPKGVRCGEGVSLSPERRDLGRGQKIFRFFLK